ncbi:MAG: ABC transporter ATP-binding protein [Candidatus Dormibacteraeota bacterium]|nr:ABC transporter ATP-binding protein [Candidatus Dormibacteraeota bacterium]
MTAIIEVDRLQKGFRPVKGWRDLLGPAEKKSALREITLSIQPGEIFGLLGPNGAGKTTLIKILSGLILPDGGRATVNGHDVVSESLKVRQSIGVVYGDERSFYWRLSVLENLRFYASLYNLKAALAEERIAWLLDRLGLSQVAHVRMHAFSSGMKQRAAIARGLINDPQVIFMDEPSRSLDPLAAAEVHDLVREFVAERGRTVVIATNLMREAEELCHRITLIDRGRCLLTGTVSDFRNHLGADVVYKLIVTPGRTGWARGLAGIPGVSDLTVEECGPDRKRVVLSMSPPASALPAVIRCLIDHGADIHSCTKQEMTLEEIFRTVVNDGRPSALRSVVQ